MKKLNSINLLKITFLLIILVSLIIYYPQINSFYNHSDSIIINAGFYAPIVYMGFMIVAILVSPIPSSPLAIIAGIIFGPLLGIIYTLIGATIGAMLAFLISRFMFRNWFEDKLKKNQLYLKIKGKKGKNLTKIVFISRLLPYISFDIVSYIAGLTEISLFKFTIATFFGMIPIVFLEVYFGALIRHYLIGFLIIMITFFMLYSIYQFLRIKKLRE